MILKTSIPLTILAFFILCSTTGFGQQTEWTGQQPSIGADLLHIAAKFDNYSVVLEPDKNEAEYWAGAPTVVRDDEGTFWMAARMRSPEHPRGLRGYEIRILKSMDGTNFEQVHEIRRDQVPIPGFERPALLIDPVTKKI